MNHEELVQNIIDVFPVKSRETITRLRKQYHLEVEQGIDRVDIANDIKDMYADIILPDLSVKPTEIYFDNGLRIEVKPPLSKASTVRTEGAEVATLLVCMMYVEQDVLIESAEELIARFPEIDFKNAPMDNNWFATYTGSAIALKEYLEGERGYTWHHEKAGVFNSQGDTIAVQNLHLLTAKLASKSYLDVGKKDTWNPSDMYICKEGRENEYADKLMTASSDLRFTNSILIEGLVQKEFVGISLKKVSPKRTPDVTEYNLAHGTTEPSYEDLRTHIPLNGKAHTCTLDVADTTTGARYQFNLRDTTATSATISLEPKKIGAHAQLGKAPSRFVTDTVNSYGIRSLDKHEIAEAILTDARGLADTFLTYMQSILDEFNATTFTYEEAREFANQAFIERSVPIRTAKVVYQSATVLAALAEARRRGEGDELLLTWLNLAQKRGSRFAPFIKIGESMLRESKEGKNLHMTHVDEAPIIYGQLGAELGLAALNKSFKKLVQAGDVRVNLKLDGSPSLFAGYVKGSEVGIETDDYVFIMALKSLFAAKPKIITRPHDIEVYYGDKPDLAEKLYTFWELLNGSSSIPDKEIWQGDIMYTEESRKSVNIDGETYFTFHPNTILYAVRAKSDVGKHVGRSRGGIVWHTRYTGSSLESMRAHHNIDESDIRDVSGLWAASPIIQYEGEALLGAAEKERYQKLESQATTLISKLQSVNSDYMTIVEANKGLIAQQINAMINSWIRGDVDYMDIASAKIPEIFLEHLQNKTTAKIENLSAKGKKTRPAEREYERWMESLDMADFEAFNEALAIVFGLLKIYTHMKMILLQGFEAIATRGGDILTYLVKEDNAGIELERTGSEGFVIEANGATFKIVDRRQFSKANWDPKYKKGWEH